MLGNPLVSKIFGSENVPSPTPNKIAILLNVGLTVNKSSILSLLKSPTDTEFGKSFVT